MESVKLFIDTNIVLDYFTGRMNDGYAKTIIQLGRNPQFELCISVLTAVNTLYVSRKYAILKPSDISGLFHILRQDYQQYCHAQTLNFNDFEDALQVACAIENECKVMITRDIHLLDSDIKSPMILSPQDFIRQVTLG
ncbi:MAG: type II toxin-antitoxin system VapC family toxin [Candidatus Cryptobacteroides sp.]